ncbi:MAG: D-alanyl-D-alanine carboxypeptidase family protein [Oscillospiraceae bacterium]|nr:D-alanyl-D-alanine carboxypeptidase family protein [Oscillospiraceae bacterium]
MSKNPRIKKRKDPMGGLIVLAVLMALLVAGCVIGGSMIKEYRANLLHEQQQAVDARNAQKQAEYEREVAQYMSKLSQADSVNEAWPTPAAEGWDIIDLTNYPLEAPGSVTVNRADIMNNGLLLINEWHSRPEDFDDSTVTGVAGYSRESGLGSFVENNTCKLMPQAIDAVIAALKDAKAVGLEGFVLQAGYTYRTWDEQNVLFQKELESQRSRHPSYSEDKLLERAKRNVNYPGTSEYNSGLAFKFYLYQSGNNELNNAKFYETAQGKWLYENSWKYGLVFRFPKAGYPMPDTTDKAYKTGVNSGLNIYRYVGIPNAEIMHHLDLCLEEYIEYLQEHSHVAVFENGRKKYEVTYQKVGDDVASFSVEINRMTSNYTMYLDNMGGVVTVYSY